MGTKWNPTPRQKKVVELLINPEDQRSKTKKLAEAGVPRRTFYHWMEDRRFLDYLSQQVDRFTDGELPEVWSALVKQCKNGDVSAIKLYFEMKNRYSPKMELSGQVDGEIRVQLAGDVETWAQ